MEANDFRLERKQIKKMNKKRNRKMEGNNSRLTVKGKIIGIILLVILLFSIGLMYKKYIGNHNYIVTNDAKVTADIINISPKIAGRIAEVNVKVGDTFNEGDILFTLESDELKNQVDEAYAAQEIAFAKLEKVVYRTKGLIKNKISSKDYEILQDNVKVALAKYNLAKLSLLDANVQAPSNGTIVQTTAHVGDFVSPEHYDMSLIDLSKLKVTAYVEQSEVKKIKKGMTAKLSIADISNNTFNGIVSEVGIATGAVYNLVKGNNSSVNSKNVPVIIDFNYIGKQVLPGMDVKVKIKVR